jgi:lipopolysaccharide biosynthesis glycosyltransferase
MEESIGEQLREKSEGYVIVTACTPSFLPGAMVMLRSFLDHNPWYGGAAVVLTNKVTSEMETCLTSIYPVSFKLIGTEIINKAAELRKAVTTGRIVDARFYSLGLFSITGYDKLLFLDSDVLIRNDVSELFLRPEAILCAGDGFHYRDKLRTGPDYRPHKLRFWQRRADYWSGNFNSGVVCIDSTIATQNNYRELVAMIDPQYFLTGVKRHNDDQLLMNIFFYGKTTLISSKYNYRLGIAKQIMAKDGVQLEDAAIVHYTARRKPWMSEMATERLATEPDFIRAYDWWQTSWNTLPESVRATALKALNNGK